MIECFIGGFALIVVGIYGANYAYNQDIPVLLMVSGLMILFGSALIAHEIQKKQVSEKVTP